MLMRDSWRARLDYLRSGERFAMPSGSHVLRVLQTYHNSIGCISMLHHSGHWNSFMSLWSCNRGLVFSPVVSIDPNASWSGTHFLAPLWMGFPSHPQKPAGKKKPNCPILLLSSSVIRIWAGWPRLTLWHDIYQAESQFCCEHITKGQSEWQTNSTGGGLRLRSSLLLSKHLLLLSCS